MIRACTKGGRVKKAAKAVQQKSIRKRKQEDKNKMEDKYDNSAQKMIKTEVCLSLLEENGNS